MPAPQIQLASRSLMACLALVATSGCRTMQRQTAAGVTNPAAVGLSPSPTLPEVARLVNANSDRVESLFAPQAQIRMTSTIGGMIAKMQTILAFERPGRLRLQGSVMGRSMVDVGLNDEIAWMWSDQQFPPAVMFVHRDDLRRGVAQEVLPLQPIWVADLLGLPEFDPNDVHSEPMATRYDDLVKVTSQSPSEAAALTRVVVVDVKRGVVVGQRLYAPGDRLVASAEFSDHQIDPTSGAILPGKIDVAWPKADQQFSIVLGPVQVNAAPTQLASALWRPPEPTGATMVDLANRDQIESYMAAQPSP